EAAAVRLGALEVGAVVAVNALGDVFDWRTGRQRAGLLAAGAPANGVAQGVHRYDGPHFQRAKADRVAADAGFHGLPHPAELAHRSARARAEAAVLIVAGVFAGFVAHSGAGADRACAHRQVVQAG